jgi:hypothetical protein
MITFKTDRDLERSRRRPLTKALRAQLASGSPEGSRPSKALLRDLKRFDEALEFHWHPFTKRWYIYRLAHKAAVDVNDQLVKVLELVGPDGEYRPPGYWCIEALRTRELHHLSTRGAQDAMRVLCENHELLERRREHSHRQDQRNAAEEMAKSYADCIREKNFIRVPELPPK